MSFKSSQKVHELAQPGDLVQFRVTLEVTGRDEDDTLLVRDVRNGDEWEIFPPTGSERLSLVKKGRPTPPPVAAGDVISGDALRARPWKRGTLIKHADIGSPLHHGWVLASDGLWHSLDYDSAFGFSEFIGEYEIVHVGA